MKKLTIAIALCGLAGGLFPACKKDMPPVIAPRWSAIEDLARAAGPICDQVLGLPQCPLEPDGLPHPEASAMVRLPTSPLKDSTEVREIEVFCVEKAQGQAASSHRCYLDYYFDPKGPQVDAGWSCGNTKPYPGWERARDTLDIAHGPNCRESLYRVSLLRKSPAGNTVQASVYFYVDGHAPASTATSAPQ